MDNLIEKLERADGADRELDAGVAKFAGYTVCNETHRASPRIYGNAIPKKLKRALPRYTADLNAALTLVPEGWDWLVRNDEVGFFANVSSPSATNYTTVNPAGALPEPEVLTARARVQGHIHVMSQSPALAVCIAALKARGAGA